MNKTNSLMNEIRLQTPPEVRKQVDLCVKIANRIYEILEERKLSQKDLAHMLGKTETEVSRWLSGTHNLTIATIAKISVALNEDIILPSPPKKRKTYKVPNEQLYIVAEK